MTMQKDITLFAQSYRQDDETEIQRYWRVLKLHKWLILGFIAAVTLATAAYVSQLTPIYRANTTVLMASGNDYYWTESWKVSSFNLTARTATFGTPTPLFPGDDAGPTVHPGPHFYVQGSVGLIDEPGEFAMDAAGEWLYLPPQGISASSCVF